MSVQELLELVPATKGLMKFVKSLRRENVKSWHHTGANLDKALRTNGHMIGRARLQHRPLEPKEKQIIAAVRALARETLEQRSINAIEMDGERDKDTIYKPIKVKTRFAYYHGGWPVYRVVESNYPVFPVNDSVSREDLEKIGQKVPKTPTFEEWDKKDSRICKEPRS